MIHGGARSGGARQGMARHGKAWQGMARHGKDIKQKTQCEARKQW